MIKNLVRTRLPTEFGDFSLCLYVEEGKEHVALVKGDVDLPQGLPVRVHSECLTGDLFGSRRCDCGDQLRHSLSYLGRQEAGLLIYLRQEGRGIGLLKKMEAYNLQDQGLDTVEANLKLGHQPDEREYGIAAAILRDLGVRSIQLMTNNPHKVSALSSEGIDVVARVPIEVGHHAENLGYLKSKAERMAHLLEFRSQWPATEGFPFLESLNAQLSLHRHGASGRPFVTLAYAQSLDGCIAQQAGHPLRLSSEPSMRLTHWLRSRHDALLIGVNTVLADDPRLTVRHCEGPSPRPVIFDSQLRLPLSARVLDSAARSPLIVCTPRAAEERRTALQARGAEIVDVAADEEGLVDAAAALDALARAGIRSVMVEGGARILSSFLRQQLANYGVITLVPRWLGGFRAIEEGSSVGAAAPHLSRASFEPLGSDVIAYGPLHYEGR